MNISDLKIAASIIQQGGIVAYPTESCYGLGCDPRQHHAVRRLLRIKRRQREQGLIVIAARLQQLMRYLDPGRTQLIDHACAVWPGPYTWLMPARPRTSAWLTGGHDKIAVRVTAHPGAAALCRYSRLALISTSANRHGRPAARSSGSVARELGDQIDFILDGRVGCELGPSQIRDAETDELIRD